MSDREHEERRDDVAAYLLGALEPGEAAALERHLAGCAECRAELDWLRPAAALVPESVERLEPSAELRGRIMETVEAEAGRRPGRARSGWTGRLPVLRPAVGLAVLAVLVAGAVGYAVHDGGGGARTTTISAGHAPGVTARMIREGETGTLRLTHVHQLPGGEVLQAWVRRGAAVESAKTLFVPNREGRATAVIDHMDGVNAVMVTAEPRGGSEQPTGEPIVAVSIPQ